MKKFIEIHDDLVPPQLVDKLSDLIFSEKMEYMYIKNITTGNQSDAEYLPGFQYNPQNKKTMAFFTQPLFYMCAKLGVNLLEVIQSRIFLQVPSAHKGRNAIHTDVPYPHWVCLYYVNDTDGDTILFDDDDQEIKRVAPKKGRIVFFDGTIRHCSSAPMNSHRAVINFDFLGEDFAPSSKAKTKTKAAKKNG